MRDGGWGRSGIPKLYVKFLWPLLLALKIRLFLAQSNIFIPKFTEGGGGSTGLGNIPNKHFFDAFPNTERVQTSKLR